MFNRAWRRVRQARVVIFAPENPIFQSKNACLADLPPGNRLRFQANLEGVVSAGELAPPSDVTIQSQTESSRKM